MEWLPVTAVSVPVEPRAELLNLLNLEVLHHLLHNPVVGRTLLRILTDQVASFIPGDPSATLLSLL